MAYLTMFLKLQILFNSASYYYTHHLVQLFIRTNPDLWKVAYITPIPKKPTLVPLMTLDQFQLPLSISKICETRYVDE